VRKRTDTMDDWHQFVSIGGFVEVEIEHVTYFQNHTPRRCNLGVVGLCSTPALKDGLLRLPGSYLKDCRFSHL
jgi:hypothetical protein